MEDLHKRRIIHRDIKPANILLNSKDEVVIADFGFARAFGETVEDASCDALDGLGIQLDVTNDQCGTPQYMAPEIWKAEPYSYAVDVYSFSVMMYEMLNGKVRVLSLYYSSFWLISTTFVSSHSIWTRSATTTGSPWRTSWRPCACVGPGWKLKMTSTTMPAICLPRYVLASVHVVDSQLI